MQHTHVDTQHSPVVQQQQPTHLWSLPHFLPSAGGTHVCLRTVSSCQSLGFSNNFRWLAITMDPFSFITHFSSLLWIRMPPDVHYCAV